MKSLQGCLLVASPHLGDPNFARTVVLLVEHDEKGAFGVVLNRPVNKTIQELWAEVNEPPCHNRQHLNLGGPVSGPLMAIHNRKALSEMEVVPGVYFSAEKDHLEKLVQDSNARMKLFIGHSGWGGGQLERELEEGAWFTAPATSEHIFHDEYGMWKAIAGRVGVEVLAKSLGIKHVPANPEVN
jgi:putative transcriptional regulator